MNAHKITGHDAIRLSERDGLTVFCHANPIDEGGPVAIGVAQQIAKDDPSLVYVQVVAIGWYTGGSRVEHLTGYNVADYFTSAGMYLGPDDEGTEPTFRDA